MSDRVSSHHPALAASPVTRRLLLAVGFLCVGIGALGVVLPILPTTPFLLVAAACFARSSERFYRWLLTNRFFGPMIRDWREHRTIPRRSKILAITMIILVGGSSVVFFVPLVPVKIMIGAFLLGATIWLGRVPSSRLAEEGARTS